MITYKIGDIFDADVQCLVNPVNCVGVMGKGLALEFKNRYPRMFSAYETLCKRRMLRLGFPWMWSNSFGEYVLLFPTKGHWRSMSQPAHIEGGLESFAERIHMNGFQYPIQSVAFPALGCGLGGLDFETDVRPLFEKYLSPLSIDVEVYTSKEEHEGNQETTKAAQGVGGRH